MLAGVINIIYSCSARMWGNLFSATDQWGRVGYVTPIFTQTYEHPPCSLHAPPLRPNLRRPLRGMTQEYRNALCCIVLATSVVIRAIDTVAAAAAATFNSDWKPAPKASDGDILTTISPACFTWRNASGPRYKTDALCHSPARRRDSVGNNRMKTFYGIDHRTSDRPTDRHA